MNEILIGVKYTPRNLIARLEYLKAIKEISLERIRRLDISSQEKKEISNFVITNYNIEADNMKGYVAWKRT